MGSLKGRFWRSSCEVLGMVTEGDNDMEESGRQDLRRRKV